MEAIRLHTKIETDGELRLRGLPCHRGEEVELILLVGPTTTAIRKPLSGSLLRDSPLVGMWRDRDDITDSQGFARNLREEAQNRSRQP